MDLGQVGLFSDGGTLAHSEFGKAPESNSIPFPSPAPPPLPGTTEPEKSSLFIFSLFLFEQAIFNYSLSRARRVIKNTFGVLAARLVCQVVRVWFFSVRWRIFIRPIIAKPDCIILYAKNTIALYNYLRTTESSVYSVYCPPGYIDGDDGAGNFIAGGCKAD